jgi:trimeric autotransporter adhesin
MKKNIQLLLFMLVFVKITVAQLPNYVPTNGLVAFWPFNGNANDVSGNGKNGTNNGANITIDRFGNSNSAYMFNGLQNRISTNLNFINSSFSISLWYNTDAPINWYPQLIVQGERPNYNELVQLLGNQPVYVSQNRVNRVNSGFAGLESNLAPAAGKWHHIVVVYNSNNDSVYLFINGNLNGSKLRSNSLKATSGNVYFGNSSDGVSMDGVGNSGYKGSMDDIGIWNRLLSQQEITNLYIACGDTFNNQPVSVVGAKGNNCNFTSTMTSTGNNFQWQSNAANLGWQNVPNSNPYVGSNTNNLSVNGLTVSNHNQRFRVIASKSGCADTSNVVSITLSNIASDSLALISLKSDTTTKGNRIRQLEIDLANNRDTLYVGSNITTDTLIISIRTGLSTASSLVNTLRVYPNPAATVLDIELEKSGTYIAKISWITGQTIVTQTAGTIDISTLASGVYVLSIFDTNNKLVSTNKISVVR